MSGDGRQRRLAAILAADVAGYTRRVEQDTDGTVAAWRAARADVIDPAIAGRSGRIVKHTGDGFLAEFPTVEDAVRCAISMQEALAASPLDFRMGINLGDVIDDGEDIHGEGVNIAARIEALADPGGIFVSGGVYDQVRNRVDHPFEDLGDHEVKHVSAPVRVYRVVVGDDRHTEDEPAELPLPDKPSIAVLPFDNMSGDPEQEYFIDGMTEDIITDLSKASGLFVIARNSSFAYKGRSPDIRRMCRELGVSHVLEGSVRRAGNRVRINAQLVEGADGTHLWAERYDRELEDIFAVQDEVTREIVAALRVKLTPEEKVRRDVRAKVNPEAYDYVYRAREFIHSFSAEAMNDARGLLERAIEIDPGLASSYAYLALISNADYLNGWNESNKGTLEEALALAQKACEIDGENALGFAALSLCHIWHGQLDAAEIAAERCLELDPNSYAGCSALGQVRDFQGDHERAVELFQMAFRLDPHVDLSLNLLGRAQFALGRDEEAEASFKRRLIRNPTSDTTRAYLAALYGQTGCREEARRVWRELMEINPSFDVQRMRTTLPYAVPTWFDRFYGGLEKAGLVD